MSEVAGLNHHNEMLDVLGPNGNCVIFLNPGNGDLGNKRCFLHFLFMPVLYVTLCTSVYIYIYFLFVCCVLCFCARSSFSLVRTGTRKGPRHRGLEWHAEVRIRLLVPGLNRMRQYPLLQQGYVVDLFLSPPRISLSLSLCVSLSIYIMLNISLSRF